MRITRWDSEPGAVTGRHHHGWPYFVVMLAAGTPRVHDGSTETDVPLAAGQSYRRPAKIEHDVIIASPHKIAVVEIEIKRPEALAAPRRLDQFARFRLWPGQLIVIRRRRPSILNSFDRSNQRGCRVP